MKSIIQRTKRDGTTEGLLYTPRDIEFLRFTAKWWCTNPDLFLRKTLPQSEWNEIYLNDSDPEWRRKNYYNLTRRFNKLVKLEQYAPLVAGMVNDRSVAYWCTPSGGELISAPWTRYPSGNVSRAFHAWAACDIGVSLERMGYTVYSEREFANGNTIDNIPVAGGKFVNALEDSKSINKDHGKRPDLAIAGDDDKFVFIEVEREVGRGQAKYKSKLESYFAHDRIGAVWYLVDTASTAKNIKTVAEELQLVSREMPVRVLKMEKGYYNYTFSTSFTGAKCQSDLDLIGANKGVNSNG